VGPMAGLNGSSGKSHPQRGFDPRTVQPYYYNITVIITRANQTFIISIAVLPYGCAVVICVWCSSAPHVALRHWYTDTMVHWYTGTHQSDCAMLYLTGRQCQFSANSLRPQLGQTFGSQLFLVYGGLRLVGNEG
jgi:hypothetical protein